ncbi:hypothetical protein ACIA5C_40125 [Actinoplanes sp. NPDC051343]|uniref:hypothetical protein n=1 Tax=Actinoplanes sp. NPDC051343 TaxID=3363906 RepID=UPI0037A6EAF1
MPGESGWAKGCRLGNKPARCGLALILLGLLASCGPVREPAPDVPDQAFYQDSITEDRSALFDATVTMAISDHAAAGKSFPLSVCIQGSQTAEDCVPTGLLKKDSYELNHYSARIRGGNIEVDVTATDPKVSVTSIWETDAPQPILAPTDTGYWAWSIVASSPGQIKLIVRVSVFHTDTKDLLEPSSEYVATVDVGKDFSYFAGARFQ